MFSLAKSPQVPGRLELVPAKRQFQVFVDYAHTPDALANVLKTLRELEPQRLIAVFGCGGDRDRQKRPLMAEIVDRHADYAIITSDNPRKENPDTIVAEIEKGFRSNQYEKMVDRTQAINRAIALARPRDIVLIAGKGHENYQEFARSHDPVRRYPNRATRDRKPSRGVLVIMILFFNWPRHASRRIPRRMRSQILCTMNPLPLSEIARFAGGSISSGDETVTIEKVTTDSRTIKPANCSSHCGVKISMATISWSLPHNPARRVQSLSPIGTGKFQKISRSFVRMTLCRRIRSSRPTTGNHSN